MSQRRRQTPPKPARRRAGWGTNRSHLLFTILGGFVAFALIASIVGPPLVDYLTSPSDGSSDTSPDVGNDDPNEAEYRKQLAENPDDPEVLAALAGYLGQIGRVGEAIPYFEQALTLAPEDWGIRLDFADALARGDKRADAELQYQKVLAAEPNNVIAHYNLARLYEAWVPPRTQDAIAEYQTVVAIGEGSYVRELAQQALISLGAASPAAGSPVPSPAATTEAGA